MAGALVAAALLRLVAFIQVRNLPNVTSDGTFYREIAQKIVGGSFLRDGQPFHFSPLYVFFLAAVFKIFGDGLNAVRVLQLLIGVGSCGLIFLIARRQFNRTAALVAVWLAALYVPFIHFETQLLSVTVTLFLMLAAIHLLLLADARARLILLLPSGLCLGLATLGSPTLLVMAAPAALWLGALRGTDPRRFPFITTRDLAPVGLFVGSVLLGVLPATAWNYHATGQLVLVSSQGGINFYIGNNPQAPGHFVVPAGMEDSLSGMNGGKPVAEAEAGRTLTAAEVSSHWFRKSFRFIRDEPAAAARLFLRKCYLFANRYEVPLDLDQEAFKQYFPLLRWPLVSYGVVSLLGWIGLAISLREFRRHALLALMLGAHALSVVAFFVSDRYRMPAVPLLILFSAFAVSWVRDKHQSKQLVAPMVAGAVAAAFAGLIVFAPTRLRGSTASLSFNMATGYLDQKDLPRARAELQRCVDSDPAWVEARYRLASVDHQLGDAVRALEGADRVVARLPRNADGHELRGRILLEKGLPRTAQREFQTVLGLTPNNAAVTAKLREAEAAIAASAGQPARQRWEALDKAGRGFLDAKQYAPAIAVLSELLTNDGVDAATRERAFAALGFSYASQGRLDLAVRAFDDARAINPENPAVHKNLALLYVKQGQRDKARPHVESLARLNPGDASLEELQASVARKDPP